MGYFVSRQKYWPDGQLVVEISADGPDHSGPDMLVPKFPGEGVNYEDPREAVKNAISIAQAWQRLEEEHVFIAAGYGADIVRLEPVSLDALSAWAEQEYEGLEKCASCGDILPDRRDCWYHFLSDDVFCSHSCADRDLEFFIRGEA